MGRVSAATRIFAEMERILSDPLELTERGTLGRPALKELRELTAMGLRLGYVPRRLGSTGDYESIRERAHDKR